MKSYAIKSVRLDSGFRAIAGAFVPADRFLKQLRAAQKAVAKAISAGESSLVPTRVSATEEIETFSVAFPFRATITARTLPVILKAGNLDADQLEIVARKENLITEFKVKFTFTAPAGMVENFADHRVILKPVEDNKKAETTAE